METFISLNLLLLWLVVIFITLITFALIRKVNNIDSKYITSNIETLTSGDVVPGFEIETLDNVTISLDDFSGIKLLMVFIAPNCSPCREQIPLLDKIYMNLQSNDIKMIVISLANQEETSKFVSEVNMQSPVSVAPPENNKLAELYKIPGTPSYYLIDSHNQIIQGGFFDDSWNNLVKTIV